MGGTRLTLGGDYKGVGVHSSTALGPGTRRGQKRRDEEVGGRKSNERSRQRQRVPPCEPMQTQSEWGGLGKKAECAPTPLDLPIAQVIPALVIAPLYFAKKIELGVISQAYSAFNHILGDFSLIISQFEALSAFSAGLTRLTTFMDRIEGGGWPPHLLPAPTKPAGTDSAPDAAPASASAGPEAAAGGLRITLDRDIPAESDVMIAMRDLSVRTPDGSRLLVESVCVELRDEDRVLIVGNSGTGKSSLIRALAGLWPRGSGSVHVRGDVDMFFLPQKPYNVLGTLRQQIKYPKLHEEEGMGQEDEEGGREGEGREGSAADEHLLQILERCQLGQLASRVGGGDPYIGLDTARDWSKELSLGEQQRLAFARIMYNKPNLVVLDEATSALDLAGEKVMYENLSSMAGVAFISIGHRPSLVCYHNKKLILRPPDGAEGEVPRGSRGEVVVIDPKDDCRDVVDLTMS